MPVSNPVQVNWGSPGAIGSVTPNTVKGTTLTIGSTPKETRSATVPIAPSVGDIWLELDGSSFPLYGWWWRWNGTYWLSPDQLMEFAPTGVTAGAYAYIHCNPSFNYYFRALNVNTFTDTAQTTSTLWTIALSRANAANTQTVMGNKTTNGNATFTWVRSLTSILTHLNVAATSTNVFLISAVPTGSAGTFYGAIQVVYNYARL